MTPEAAPRTAAGLDAHEAWHRATRTLCADEDEFGGECRWRKRILAIEAEMQELTDETSEASYLLGRAEAWEAAKPLVRACETREPIDELLVRNLAQSLRYALAEAAQPATPVGALDVEAHHRFTVPDCDWCRAVRASLDADLAAASEPAGGGEA